MGCRTDRHCVNITQSIQSYSLEYILIESNDLELTVHFPVRNDKIENTLRITFQYNEERQKEQYSTSTYLEIQYINIESVLSFLCESPMSTCVSLDALLSRLDVLSSEETLRTLSDVVCTDSVSVEIFENHREMLGQVIRSMTVYDGLYCVGLLMPIAVQARAGDWVQGLVEQAGNVKELFQTMEMELAQLVNCVKSVHTDMFGLQTKTESLRNILDMYKLKSFLFNFATGCLLALGKQLANEKIIPFLYETISDACVFFWLSTMEHTSEHITVVSSISHPSLDEMVGSIVDICNTLLQDSISSMGKYNQVLLNNTKKQSALIRFCKESIASLLPLSFYFHDCIFQLDFKILTSAWSHICILMRLKDEAFLPTLEVSLDALLEQLESVTKQLIVSCLAPDKDWSKLLSLLRFYIKILATFDIWNEKRILLLIGVLARLFAFATSISPERWCKLQDICKKLVNIMESFLEPLVDLSVFLTYFVETSGFGLCAFLPLFAIFVRHSSFCKCIRFIFICLVQHETELFFPLPSQNFESLCTFNDNAPCSVPQKITPCFFSLIEVWIPSLFLKEMLLKWNVTELERAIISVPDQSHYVKHLLSTIWKCIVSFYTPGEIKRIFFYLERLIRFGGPSFCSLDGVGELSLSIPSLTIIQANAVFLFAVVCPLFNEIVCFLRFCCVYVAYLFGRACLGW